MRPWSKKLQKQTNCINRNKNYSNQLRASGAKIWEYEIASISYMSIWKMNKSPIVTLSMTAVFCDIWEICGIKLATRRPSAISGPLWDRSDTVGQVWHCGTGETVTKGQGCIHWRPGGNGAAAQGTGEVQARNLCACPDGDSFCLRIKIWKTCVDSLLFIPTNTSSTAAGSFKNRKPIGEVGCAESRMAERIHWWTNMWLELCFFGVATMVAVVTLPELLDVVWGNAVALAAAVVAVVVV